MQPDWHEADDNNTFFTATFGSCQLSVFRTMFGSFSYAVNCGGRIERAGNVGELKAAKAEVLRLAQELDT